MFFVVTTGRSGSQTIAHVLSQSSNCICLHEPDPVLVKEATLYQYGLISDEMMRVILRCTRHTTLHGKIYGESNQKMSTLIPVLIEVFPEAHFLWLVRDGRDVVTSTYYAREWYKSVNEVIDHPEPFSIPLKEWTWYRLRGDLIGDMSTSEWEALTRFEKNCWLWARTNQIIYENLARIPNERWMLVRLESLFEQLPEICRFLDIEAPELIDEEHYNVSNVRMKRWTEWSKEQKDCFKELCGDAMGRLYPDWCDDDGNWQEIGTRFINNSGPSVRQKAFHWWRQIRAFRRLAK